MERTRDDHRWATRGRDGLAHLAGVSTAVVSYVVNDGPDPSRSSPGPSREARPGSSARSTSGRRTRAVRAGLWRWRLPGSGRLPSPRFPGPVREGQLAVHRLPSAPPMPTAFLAPSGIQAVGALHEFHGAGSGYLRTPPSSRSTAPLRPASPRTAHHSCAAAGADGPQRCRRLSLHPVLARNRPVPRAAAPRRVLRLCTDVRAGHRLWVTAPCGGHWEHSGWRGGGRGTHHEDGCQDRLAVRGTPIGHRPHVFQGPGHHLLGILTQRGQPQGGDGGGGT